MLEIAPPVAARRLVLDGHGLTPRQVEDIARGEQDVTIDPAALERVARSHATLTRLMRRPEPIYGVTTGFGALVSTRVPDDRAASMQLALLRSHAAGVGEPLPAEAVRAAIAVRLDGLLKGNSGVTPRLAQALADLLNARITPRVPRTGSLGASGDLAPSAHAFLVLVGEGEAIDADGRTIGGAEALRRAGLTPVTLGPKEGLALINGTHFMAGLGALHVQRMHRLLSAADRIAAATTDALRGTTAAFDARAVALRPLPGQQQSAHIVRAALTGSTRVRQPGEGAPQDSYALRCIPQVHGSAREALAFTERIVGYDLDAVTDNPVIVDEDVISAGNFHGQSLALAFDTLRLAIADLASLSERRSFRLLAPSLNGPRLPGFLTPDPGHSSGLMIAQYTAAALLQELKVLAHPVSADSVPTSDNQEDHISNGMTGATMTGDALDRLAQVLAIELLCACQAIDLDPDGRPGLGTRALHEAVRAHVPRLVDDRPPSPDISAIAALVEHPPIAQPQEIP